MESKLVENFEKRIAAHEKRQRAKDLKEFTKAAMQGLLANPNITSNDFMAVQDQAVYLAKATLEALSNEE